MYHTEPRLSSSFASFIQIPGMPARRRRRMREMREMSATTVLHTGLVAAEVGDLHQRPRWVKGAGRVLTLASVHSKENTGFQARLRSQFPEYQQRVIIITADFRLRAMDRGKKPGFAEYSSTSKGGCRAGGLLPLSQQE